MPAAILIPLAIQAGASVGKALIEKHAAGKASQQLQAAGERARQDLSPYANAGARAATTLSDLTFGGPQQSPQPLQPQQPPPGSMAAMARPGVPPGSPLGRQEAMLAQQGPPPPGSMAAMGRGGAQPTASGYGQQPQGGGVQMQGPDGQVVMIPHELVQEAEAHGGRRVG